MIDRVAKLLREVGDKGEPQIPVSFNLSRVDFAQTDPYKETERAVAKYGVDRRLFKVEITESTLISDPQKLQDMFTRFHDNGYDIWMDDFGSGYSTLNVLKDYSFDEIKIDMLFLRGLNQRGRSIVSSIVRMAKSLDIHTLTEGAETKEQVDFLREIGCEKIQGYYFGAPMPYEKLIQHCMDFGLFPESEEEALVYDAAGAVDFLADRPMSLLDYKNGNLKLLFSNKSSKEILKTFGDKSEDFIDEIFENRESNFYRKFTNFLKRVEKSEKEEMLNHVYNGRYYRIYASLIKKVNDHSLFTVSAYDITYDVSQKGMRRFNDLLRETNQIYNHIYLWSPKDDKIEVVESEESGEKTGDVYLKVKSVLRQMAESRVAFDDQERFMNFLNANHIKATLTRLHSNFTGECFRVMKADGDYAWDEIDVMSLRNGDFGEYLVLERRAALEDVENTSDIIRRIDASAEHSSQRILPSEENELLNIYRTIADYSNLKFFWKDNKRGFCGVSKAFLEFYGINSAADIIGKTDEEMGWHIDNEPYYDNEKEILKDGKVIRDSIGHTLAGGKIHIISATKFPIYKGDTIVGLAGFFTELDSLKNQPHASVMTDPVTGFMNGSGFMASMAFYHDNYERTGDGYTVAYLNLSSGVSDHRVTTENAKRKLKRRVSLAISNRFAENELLCSLAKSFSFIVLTKESTGKVRDHIDELQRDISEIKYVGSQPVNLSMNYSLVRAEEEILSDELIPILKERCRIETISNAGTGADRLTVEMEKFNDMDERIYICAIDDYSLLYLNHTGKSDLGLPEDYDYRGKKCYEVLHHYDHPCDHCSTPQCSRDCFFSHHYHNAVSGQEYMLRDTLVDYAGRKAKLSMGFSLSDSMKEVVDTNNSLHRRVRINDLIGDALEERDADRGIDRMLESLGKEFSADRAYIFEERDGVYIDNTYEWCRTGVTPEKDLLQNIPITSAAGFYAQFLKNSSIVIDDVEKYHGTILYGILKPQQIRRLVATPIKEKGEIIGFVGVDNPSTEVMKASESTLSSLARFISALLRNRNVVRALDDMSQRDHMTGVMNRRALRHIFPTFDESSVVAVVYADVNGLKDVNDSEGHEAGDELIIKAADAMTTVAGSDRVFRMGGDEFVILFEVKFINQIDDKLEALRKAFDKEGLSIALGVAARTDGDTSLEKLLDDADERMYENKKRMHSYKN